MYQNNKLHNDSKEGSIHYIYIYIYMVVCCSESRINELWIREVMKLLEHRGNLKNTFKNNRVFPKGLLKMNKKQ